MFAGIPVFSRFQQDELLPHAVLVCVRCCNSRERPPNFEDSEISHLQIVSSQISYALDTLRWREDAWDRRQRQLEITNIWASRKDDSTKLAEA